MKYNEDFGKLLEELMTSPSKGHVSRHSNIYNTFDKIELNGRTYDVMAGSSAEVCSTDLVHLGRGLEIVLSTATECVEKGYGCKYESVKFVAVRPDNEKEGRWEMMTKGMKYYMVPKSKMKLGGTASYVFYSIECDEDGIVKYPAVWFRKEPSCFPATSNF